MAHLGPKHPSTRPLDAPEPAIALSFQPANLPTRQTNRLATIQGQHHGPDLAHVNTSRSGQVRVGCKPMFTGRRIAQVQPKITGSIAGDRCLVD
ncbi:hypothetical protein AMR42_13455 [Limnothrix sp. PR1529]|nr:hypothetical protein BCR12_08610 [Limnothrix sp. P13C2]PIB08484.1 hypothetical protein AMR42_13455 [Limnothrix sp. PR1529]